MTELMQKLVESSEAVPLMFKEYVTLVYEGRIDPSGKTIEKRVLDIFYKDAGETQTQLAEQLGLLRSSCFPPFVWPMQRITSSRFTDSIQSYPEEWRQALIVHGDDEQVQLLITELLSFPIELQRLIESVKRDYRLSIDEDARKKRTALLTGTTKIR